MIIYLDFDGTVVEHQYPKIGRCNFGCFEIIKKLQDAGHEIILNTYRADEKNGTLEAALKYINEDSWMLLKDRSLRDSFELKAIKSCPRKTYPNKWSWDLVKETKTLWIDDQAQDIPLKEACMTDGMMVDWDELDRQFIKHGMYGTNS